MKTRLVTKIQRTDQGARGIRHHTTIPWSIVDLMELDGKKLRWNITGKDKIELTVIENEKESGGPG